MERLDIWGRQFAPASTWNELTRAQLADVVRVLYGPAEFWPTRLRLLSVITGAEIELLIELPEVQVKGLYGLTDFVFSDEHHLTRQLLPELHQPAKTTPRKDRAFTGPGDALSGVRFGEFMFADTYFCQYALRKSPEALDHFLAALYRPARAGVGPGQPDWNGDARQPFNEHNVAHYAHRLRHVADTDKLSIMLWYRGCRAQLQADYPDVFDAADNTTAAQEKGDWGRVLRQLSGGAFGPLEQTAGQHLRTILAEMNDRAREARKHQTAR
ncbi:hypothetical protein CDA63_11710 [Hymenobacter amundsenii]|uniref:Uncharacterized protein n=1 Tax=Hymenobacter amundsenii TaxID=2006685 RepID=A0A246FJZ4_9BACT|nr:hypothetical protein [Hymenobacter amundsenii]OWP62877.1 hypothetical protein CDA63_11710 [Hymenobacter amundsenii]